MDELDVVTLQGIESRHSLGEGPAADEVPQLGEADEEPVRLGDHPHLVVRGQAPPQVMGGSEPAEATSEHDHLCQDLASSPRHAA